MIRETWPPDSTTTVENLTFDYIVVGGGTAGCVVASRLSEDSCRRVLLVEAGGDPPMESLVPATWSSMLPTKYNWQYQSENDSYTCQGASGGRCEINAGKMLGGSSSINMMSYYRGNRQDYDNIERAGNPGWDYLTALSYFKKSENCSIDFIRDNPRLSVFRNFDGPISVTLFDDDMESLNSAIVKAYGEAGYQYNLDPNGWDQMGVYPSQATIDGGVRDGTARAYLVPAKDRPNLVVFKNSIVSKILITNGVATGVRIILQNDTVIEAGADKEVILCAGAIRSPQILMLSGIGPRSHLEKFKIPVITDLAVGRNLIDHVTFNVSFSISDDFDNGNNRVVDVARYLSSKTGFFSAINPQLKMASYITTNISVFDYNIPNFQIFHSMQSLTSKSVTLVFFLFFLDEESRGNVTLASTDIKEQPKIYLNYFQVDKDMEHFLKAVDFVVNLVDTPTFRKLAPRYIPYPDTKCGDFNLKSRNYWRCIILRQATSASHLLGTSKMGPEKDLNAVVNSDLQVYGVKNLRVVDGSVIPSAIRGNPYIPIVMFAERAADLVKESHKTDACNMCHVT